MKKQLRLCLIISILTSSFIYSQPIRLIKDIQSGAGSSIPFFGFPSSDTLLYFGIANDGIHGEELWTTDGTDSGTVLLKDINIGLQSSNITGLTNFNGKTLFCANDGINGNELWVTDGTSSGTSMLMDIYPGQNSGIATFKKEWEKNGVLYFLADDGVHGLEIWFTDCTPSGTGMLLDINPGVATFTFGNIDSTFFEFQGDLYFAANDGVHGFELWRTDGNSSGTNLVLDLNPGFDNSFFLTSITNVFQIIDNNSGHFYFVAPDPSPVGDDHVGLFSSDGTNSGTFLVKAFNNNLMSFIPGANSIMLNNNVLLFPAAKSFNRREIWRTDGTAQGTYLIKDINQDSLMASVSDSPFRNMLAFNGYASFIANDGITGNEIWLTYGDSINTALLYDINSGSSSCDCSSFTEFNGKILFVANDSIHGHEIWQSDGTAFGTYLLKDVNPGVLDGVIAIDSYNSQIGNKIIFRGNQSATGVELWSTDGTSINTQILSDFNPGPQSSNYNGFYNLNGYLLFSLDNSLIGEELYRTDGTPNGTSLVADINPGSGGSNPGIVNILINNKLLFSANSQPATGRELWVTDGTTLGTQLIQDLNPGIANSSPNYFQRLFGNIYFQATTAITGTEFWSLDTSFTSNVNNSIISSNILSVYPNPCMRQNSLQIINNSPTKNLALFIFDSENRLLKSMNLLGRNNMLDVSSFSPGIYFISSESEGQLSTATKLVIQ